MSIPTHRWTLTDALPHRILDAATEAFAASGFAKVTMADVVDRSGAGVGSIARQFGGTRELFLAVFDRLVTDVDRHIGQHMDRHTDQDVDPNTTGAAAVTARGRSTFEALTRAYLEALWLHRRAAVACSCGDSPAGFEGLREARMRGVLQRWAPATDTAHGQLLIRMLSSILAEASSLVILCDDQGDAALITDVTVEAVDRLTR